MPITQRQRFDIQCERRLTAENILVCWRKNDVAYGKQVAEYYQQKRNIPDSNMVEIDVQTFSGETSVEDCIKVRETVLPYVENLPIHAFVLCGDWPRYMFNWTNAGTLWAGLSFDDLLKFLFYPLTTTKDNQPPLQDLHSKSVPNLQNVQNGFVRKELEDKTLYGRWDDKGWQKVKRWEPEQNYSANDIVFMESVSESAPLICEIGGLSGKQELTIFTGLDPEPYFTDGTVTWRYYDYPNFETAKLFAEKKYLSSGGVRMQKDFIRQIKNSKDDSWLPKPWRRFGYTQNVDINNSQEIAFVVTHLVHPSVFAEDAWSSRLEATKALIDRSIAFENANHTSVPGTQILSGLLKGSSSSTIFAITELLAFQNDYAGYFDQNKIFWDKMDLEAAETPDYSISIAENFPSGATGLYPETGVTYVNTLDVFFHAMGNRAYFANDRLPFQKGVFGYLDGAITIFGQSCGLSGDLGTEINYETQYTISQTENPNAISLPNAGDKGKIYFPNERGTTRDGFYLKSTDASTTVEVTGDNQITLTDATNGTTVLNIPTGTLRSQYNWISTNLPANWTISISCAGSESRGAHAIRNGACVAVGAPLEPMLQNAPCVHNFFTAFLHGHCLAEAARHLQQGYSNTISQCQMVIGDPLYRPFHKLENCNE